MAVAKGPDAFRTISEASAELGVPTHVLRFWETKFAFVRPMKRAGGRRFYRPQDLAVLRGVRALLHEEGYTIKGVQKLHKDGGVRRLVAAGGADAATAEAAERDLAEAADIADLANLEPDGPELEGSLVELDADDDDVGFDADLTLFDADPAAPGVLAETVELDEPEPEPEPLLVEDEAPDPLLLLAAAAAPASPLVEDLAPSTLAAPARESERVSLPVLDAGARSRLTGVLADLEAAKAAIDALLARPGPARER